MAITTKVTMEITLNLTEIRALRMLLGDITGGQQDEHLREAGKKVREYSEAIDDIYKAIDINGD